MQYILIALPITVDPSAELQVSFSVPDGSQGEECNETQATYYVPPSQLRTRALQSTYPARCICISASIWELQEQHWFTRTYLLLTIFT